MARSYAIATIPDRRAFQVSVQGVLGRLDELALPEAVASLQLHVDTTLTGVASGPIALVSARTTVPVLLANHTAAGQPASVPIGQALDLQPASQIDSTDSFTVSVAISAAGADGVEHAAHSILLAAGRLLHFNGTLHFGAVAVRLNEVSNTPAPLGPAYGGGEMAVSFWSRGSSPVCRPVNSLSYVQRITRLTVRPHGGRAASRAALSAPWRKTTVQADDTLAVPWRQVAFPATGVVLALPPGVPSCCPAGSAGPIPQ
jgi:hypothetical protein